LGTARKLAGNLGVYHEQIKRLKFDDREEFLDILLQYL